MYKEHLTIPQSPEFTARVLSYEVGDITKLMVYRERFGKTGYLGEMKIALADALTMVHLLIEQEGHDIEDLKNIGLERFIYRMKECAHGKPIGK